MGTATSTYAPSEAFECRDHRYVNVSAPNQRIWGALCEAIARPDLLEMPEFRTNHDRVTNRPKLSAILAGEFAAYDLARWRYRLHRYAVPHGEYIVLDDVVAGMSQAEIGRYITAVPHLPGGELKVGAPPWKFSRSKAKSAVSARAGQHQSQFTDLPLPADQTSEGS
jgi:crotonobetainyl-CoA:carnitine CoA-transferase CaiB-like acyl-CoA transferase